MFLRCTLTMYIPRSDGEMFLMTTRKVVISLLPSGDSCVTFTREEFTVRSTPLLSVTVTAIDSIITGFTLLTTVKFSLNSPER